MTAPTKGQTWAAKVRKAYTLNEAQDATVYVAADIMDQLERLPMSNASERRQQQTALLRALSFLALPDAEGDEAPKHQSASQRGRKAAQVRWDRQRAAS